MTCKYLFAVAGIAAIVGSIAVAQPAKDVKPAQPAKDAKPTQPAKKAAADAAQPEGMPQMTDQQMKDMQACMDAAQTGPQHAELAKAVGTWAGKTKMWMSPDAPPMASECTQTVTSIMDGRFIRIEVKGDMMGQPFTGFGIVGFDNVSKKYVCSWLDNYGTGIMQGTGEATSDGKVMTFKYNYNCPITKKPAVMREVHTHTGPDSYTLEMFTNDPHTGKEGKMMEIAFTRSSAPSAKADN